MSGIAAAAALCILAAGAVILIIRVSSYKIDQRRPVPMDDLDGHDFEYFCADLLKRNGFVRVRVTRGSGDFGADILASKDDVTYAIQCKCYDGSVGVTAVQEVYAGRDYYGCMVGIVMTNSYFTASAETLAGRLHILLWDRSVIDELRDAKNQ